MSTETGREGEKGGSALVRLGALSGILAPIMAFACKGLSVYLSPWFRWTDNWLSDLGGFPGGSPTWSARGAPSVIFNAGLIVAGALGLMFTMGLSRSGFLDNSLGKVGIVLLFLDMVALIGIGTFPETAGIAHGIFSILFFSVAGLVLIFVTASLFRSGQKRFGWLALVLLLVGLGCAPLFMVDPPLGSNAIAEIIPAILISIFSVTMGAVFLKSEGNKKEAKNDGREE